MEEELIVEAFLELLDEDLQRAVPLNAALLLEVKRLLGDVSIDLDAPLD